MIEATWGATIRRLRLGRGFTQRELAARSGVEQAQISRLEAGLTCDPKLSTLLGLGAALGVSIDTLLGLRPPEPGPQEAALRHFVGALLEPSGARGRVGIRTRRPPAIAS